MPDIESFLEFDLGDEIQGAIRAMGIEVPTPIQKLATQPVLEGRDVIAKAETGTGKTLAFGAPMMARIDPERASVLGMVLCPTRELAQQVADVLAELGKPRGILTALVVGGDPLMPQVKALKAGAQVVVGTPGRVLDLYQQRFLSFPWTEFCVLDEADKMFEIGFADDVRKIMSFMPDERQTMLFSATYPREVLKLARESTKNPVEIATAKGASTVEAIEQLFMKVDDEDKSLALIRLMEGTAKDDVLLVFCDRRTDVDRLMRRLERTRFSIKALHGGYDQAARFRVMSAFRTGEVKALVATDVASRGLDVNHVTHVINFGVPRELEEYTHRIGRTGRAGRSGTAITFVNRRDYGKWNGMIERTGWDVREVQLPSRPGPLHLTAPAGKPSAKRSPGPQPEREDRPRTRRGSEDSKREPRRAQPARNKTGETATRSQRTTESDSPRKRESTRERPGQAKDNSGWRPRKSSGADSASGTRTRDEEAPRRRTRSRDDPPRPDGEDREQRPARRKRADRPAREENSSKPEPTRNRSRNDQEEATPGREPRPAPRRSKDSSTSGPPSFGAGTD